MSKTLDDKVLIEIYQSYQHNLLLVMHESLNHGHYNTFLKANDYYYVIEKRLDILYNKDKVKS
jgi:hypothetical protein